MEEYLKRLDNKYSEDKLQTLFDKYDMISQDTLVNILADALDLDPVQYYKGYHVIGIKVNIQHRSDRPGLDVPTDIIKHYIDNVMPFIVVKLRPRLGMGITSRTVLSKLRKEAAYLLVDLLI